jgi:phage/plasmid primase-like uncharacterized protein
MLKLELEMLAAGWATALKIAVAIAMPVELTVAAAVFATTWAVVAIVRLT